MPACMSARPQSVPTRPRLEKRCTNLDSLLRDHPLVHVVEEAADIRSEEGGYNDGHDRQRDLPEPTKEYEH